MKFRKKPIVIEAIQWTGNNENVIMDFVGKKLRVSCPPNPYEHDHDIPNSMVTITIPTLEGDMVASKRDWIIKGVKGEFYPCKPDIFEATYESASTPPQLREGEVEDGWVKISNEPPHCTIIDGYNEKWVDEDFNPEGIRECFLTDEGNWVSAKWNAEHDCWDNDEEPPVFWKRRIPPFGERLTKDVEQIISDALVAMGNPKEKVVSASLDQQEYTFAVVKNIVEYAIKK